MATNKTIKKNDGTTDIVYTAIQASGGENSPAVYRSETVGSAAAHRPRLEVKSRSNGPKTARRVEALFYYPTTVTGSDGKISVVDKAVGQVSFLNPLAMPTTDANEAASQFCNLVGHPDFKAMLKAGYAEA